MVEYVAPMEADGEAAVVVRTRTAPRPHTTVALAFALFALSALDLAVTQIGVDRYGAVELNPLMSPILGTAWAPLVKLGLPAMIIALAYNVRTQFAVRALRAAVAVYLIVVIFNIAQFAVVLTV